MSPLSPSIAALAGFLLTFGCGRIDYDSSPSVEDAGGYDAAPELINSFSRICQLEAHVIIENGIAVDDDVGRALSDAVQVGCGSAITRRTVSQDDSSAVDTDSGRPLVPANELVVLGGGDGPHRVVRYLLQADTPLIWTGGSPLIISERATGRVIAQGPTDSTADFLLLQVIHEPISDTLSVSAQGIHEEGTRAAIIYLEETIVPSIISERASWFVVRWTDTGADGATADDSFLLIDSGP